MKKTILATLACLSLAAPALADDATVDIWKAKCKSCHGDDGKAKTKMGEKEKIPDLTDAGWQKKHSDADIKETITNGSKENAKMKAFKDKLTPEQIDGLVKYIRAMKAS